MRPRREDAPGRHWLLTNRGLAKRAVFETRQDVERFCAALAEVVEDGLLIVHAFVFMTTHFHVLVESPVGEVSRAMKLVTNAFVRWFNRSRKRDGPLFARRFHGRVIGDAAHWETVLRYIDLNPVRAGMCGLPSDHPFGSARALRYETGPAWLTRDRVLATLRGFNAPEPYRPELYDAFAACVDPDVNAYLVERMLAAPAAEPPPLVDLIRTANLRQQSWMEWKAALADGMAVGTAFLPPSEALRAARAVIRVLERQDLPAGRRTLPRDLSAGLLRGAAGRQISEISDDLGIARSTVSAALRRHNRWTGTAPCYAELVERALQSAVRRVLPPPSSPLGLSPRVGS